MPDPKPMSATVVLKKYFAPNTPLQEFANELKQLSPEEKRELSEGAARELGVELEAPKDGEGQ